MGMATDYDAPRKTDDDTESIEALKERVPDKMSGSVDVDDAITLAVSNSRVGTSVSTTSTWSSFPHRPMSSPVWSASS